MTGIYSNPPSPVITKSQDGILIANTSGKEYQWQVGGEVLDVISISISPRISGIYKMRVKGENGLFSEYSNELQIIISNIVENPKEEITIYPNPTDNILKIKFGDVPEDKVYINIIDTAGKLIISDKTRIDKFSNISIDVSDYCEGIYFIRIKAGEELIRTEKFFVY